MKIRLIRHATLLLQFGSKTILIDPMFSPAGAMSATPNTSNQKANPLIDLPCAVEELTSPDAILLTHSHRDHFDDAAANLLPREIPFFCQPEDVSYIQKYGFSNVVPIEHETIRENIRIIRTGGRHGLGEIGQKMGPVSGYILSAEKEPAVYFAGDTVWCPEVESALDRQPDVVVLFAGAAQFLEGGAITMTKEDVATVCRKVPTSKVAVVHMEAWNHCLLSRQSLQEYLAKEGVMDRVVIPADGEWF
ncbi:MBL fold metallo-hydrolase [Effusibacillus dendaii]|uniref:MBL fold metallo-hydrolase n=1 Tax=Effusibacillus dendaii TaxID=2743772 RepID=A0A7I8DK43_9BACL|nr:MBL fold metallo-hydrolase [Effusibacillus dendaii]BCJ88261.1 MBL fold metallo-hydrolase [Effusibacillus dendaii]